MKCKICSRLRPLPDHLFEMAEFCLYLDNTAPFNDGDGYRQVRTVVISDWLRLASQLAKVEIDCWQGISNDVFFCDPLVAYHDSNSEHFTKYSTALTRFIFVCNALEETYRFVSHNYDHQIQDHASQNKSTLKASSMKSALLIDRMDISDFPENFQHITDNLITPFEEYNELYSPHISGMKQTSKTDFSYALHLTRNLRNHIVHGVFPLADNPEYVSDPPLIFFQNLLHHACRVATIYMQILIGKYCKQFQSDEYESMQDDYGIGFEEIDRFIDHCRIDYWKKLHVEGPFSLSEQR